MIRPPVIHEAYQCGNPADASFGYDQAQLRIALWHPRPDELGHATLPGQNLRLDDSSANAEFYEAVVDRLTCGADVDRHWQVSLLERGPQRFVGGVRVGPIDHRGRNRERLDAF